MTTKKHKGKSLDDFLEEDGLLEAVGAAAIKRVIAAQLEKMMKIKHLSKTKLANEMHTSRSALDRLLDPENTSITLYTLVKVAHILGKKIQLSLV